MSMIINIIAFVILTLLWLGFGTALLFNREVLDTIWQSFRNLPFLFQAVIGLLVLPLTVGLWIWESAWPLWLRLLLVLSLGIATVYVFFPWKPKS